MAPTTENEVGTGDADHTFLVLCLKHAIGDITIDINAVAAEHGFKNPKSASNKLAVLRKKYNLSIGVTNSGGSLKAPAATTSNAAAGPIAPTKVTKKGTPRKPGANKAKKHWKAINDDDDQFGGTEVAKPVKSKTSMKGEIRDEDTTFDESMKQPSTPEGQVKDEEMAVEDDIENPPTPDAELEADELV
ncbi:MAG: hypothetical protein M1833_003333 [Piccolia ochrophora]|nr:MAG: hypothetical protein M1833_003333 [Piccolia ochrophora]